MKNRKLTQVLDSKLPSATTGSGKENNRWVVLDGKKVLRVTYPKGHSGDVKPLTLKSIREQMKLEKEDFEQFVECKMSGADYEVHLRKRFGTATPDSSAPQSAPPSAPTKAD